MWKLILCLFAIINAAESKWVYANSGTDDDVASLDPVTARQALPFILFASQQTKKLQTLSHLLYANIENGRLVSGTTFCTIPQEPQLFFCQNPDRTKRCLVPKKFGQSEILECLDDEPMPILQPYPGRRPCGAHNTGHLMAFYYEICAAQKPYEYNADVFHIYTFCYDASAKRNLFAYYDIRAPILLGEKLLTREREAVLLALNVESYGFIDKNYYAELLIRTEEYPHYGLQELVPSEDMPLVTGRKATHYHANFVLQHAALKPNWNRIRLSIRNQAIKWSNQTLSLMTGVFDIPENEISTPLCGRQIATIWVTVVTTKIETDVQGLAILMNNFIAEDSCVGSSQQQFIDKLCVNTNDSCASSLKQEFEVVRGKVRCCEITLNIMYLFFHGFVLPSPLTQLKIPDITD